MRAVQADSYTAIGERPQHPSKSIAYLYSCLVKRRGKGEQEGRGRSTRQEGEEGEGGTGFATDEEDDDEDDDADDDADDDGTGRELGETCIAFLYSCLSFGMATRRELRC